MIQFSLFQFVANYYIKPIITMIRNFTQPPRVGGHLLFGLTSKIIMLLTRQELSEWSSSINIVSLVKQAQKFNELPRKGLQFSAQKHVSLYVYCYNLGSYSSSTCLLLQALYH